ncbi:MAG: TetR/AcrR family transcriptional regulator [Acidobacteria bacterium]|nr:TetR/AcrR family transcriptional regulator [Acidobacteriota bacterium]
MRIASQSRPAELLDDIVGYLVKHGVAELSLRPLAKAVGSSPRVLLYYFGSKEELIVKALTRLRERQRSTFGAMREAKYDRPSDACRAIWMQMSAPQSERLFQFFFETYALALRHPKRFGDFLHNAVQDWIDFVAAPLLRKGLPGKDAHAFATIVLAGFRGFMLDYCASRDRPRIDHAVDLWLHSLDTISSYLQENSHAR